MKNFLLTLIMLAVIPLASGSGKQMTEGQAAANASRKYNKQQQTEQSVDSLVLNANFKFEPGQLTISNSGNAGVYNWSRTNYVSIQNGWLNSLIHDGVLTKNYEITKCVKLDGVWYMTVKVDKITEMLTYNFEITAKTGRGTLAVTSNRYGGEYTYTGYLVAN